MNRQLLRKLLVFLLIIYPNISIHTAEENFLLINGITTDIASEIGAHIDDRVTPCCTFNFALSLMGYDTGILENEDSPTWPYCEGYVADYDSWKLSQNPQTWITTSCVWYSELLGQNIGLTRMQRYLALFNYGNLDISGDTKKPWISSSLKISLREQVNFMRNIVQGKIAVSPYALQMTKMIFFKEDLKEGWKLYGKTGKGSIICPETNTLEIIWFVGWIEKEERFFPFAYNIRDKKLTEGLSVSRVKELIVKSQVMKSS